MEKSSSESKSLHIVSGGDPTNSDRISQDAVSINSCGYNSIVGTSFSVNRPFGRSDFQIIYIETGTGHFFLNGEIKTYPAGTLILYKPGEPQVYTYESDGKIKAFWIHFTGVQVETLLKQNGLWENTVYAVGREKSLSDLIMKIARELQLKSFNYLQMTIAYFLELITMIARNIHNQHIPTTRQFEAFVPVIELLQREYYKDFTVDFLASMCSMSAYHFIRLFKEYTGMSPHRYQTGIRLEKSKLLLLNTSSPISEIAFSVGYDNALYFSRLFKKYNGMSPSEFKELNNLG